MRRDQSQRGRRERMPVSRSSGFVSPFEDLFDPFRMFEEAFGGRFPRLSSELERRFSPAMDVEESDSEYCIIADLPGVKKEDLSIDCSENQITISAERREEEQSEQRRSTRRFYGSFRRSFLLPNGVNADEIRADYENGELVIHIPKSEKSRPRRIEIGERHSTAASNSTAASHDAATPHSAPNPREGQEQQKPSSAVH
ncbi:MAG: Hsp20/alpha crystallin family protein [Bdellovibrionales bacterium]